MRKLALALATSLMTCAASAQTAATGTATPSSDGAAAQPPANATAVASPAVDGSAATASIPVQPLPDSAAASAPAEANASTQPSQLGEVTVTAQKTKQSARKVPMSLTAVSGDFIKEVGAASLADVSLYVPNARVDAHDMGSPQVFIRGFGTNAFNPAFESSVAFVQDDLYFGRPGYFTESMYDIDRVEVLRGPQGTLFGKNTIAGVFNVTTKGPQGDPTANVDVFAGTHDERRIEGGAGGMFTDSFGARVGFLYKDVGGETYNSFLNREEDASNQRAMRGKFRWLPFEHVTTELMASTSRTSAPFWPYQLFKLDSDTRTYLQKFDPNVEDNPKDFQTEFDTPGWIKKGSDTGSLKTDWDMGERMGLTNLTSTLILGASGFFIDQLNDLDNSPADIARLDSHEHHNQQTAELRFTGKAESLFGFGSGLDFVSGLYHYQSRYRLLARVLAGQDFGSYLTTNDAAELATAGTPAAGIGGAGLTSGLSLPGIADLRDVTAPLATNGDYYQFNYNQKAEADALFAQSTIKLTPKLALVPGVRLGLETKTVDVIGHGYCNSKNATETVTSFIPGVPSTCIVQTLLKAEDYSATNQQRKEYDFSPKVALQYFADHGINYYASFAKAAKSGGFNALALNTDHLQFQGEKATTFEIGAKGRFFDRTLNVNLGVYRTNFDNLQVLAFNGVAFDVGNAAAVSSGVEGDFQWLTPYRPLKFIGSFGILDAHYTHYANGPAPIADGIGATQDLSGKRVAFAPRGTGTFTPILTYPLFDKTALSLSGDVIYQGNQYTDTDLDPNVYTASYVKYNARIILGEVNDRWSFSIGGTNLGDKRVLNQVIDTIFFPGTYQAQQAAGRQVFAQVRVKM